MSKKTIHEDFAQFFENPTRDKLRNILKNNFGETRNLEFKQDWPDLPELARHILGMANTEGGVIVIGIQETDENSFTPAGLEKIKDKVDILNGIKRYLPEELMEYIDIIDFSYRDSEYSSLKGKSFQTIIINTSDDIGPFVTESDGKGGIRRGAIYYRHEGETREATHGELQKIINKRINSNKPSASGSGLNLRLSQLNILYSHIEKYDHSLTLGHPDMMAIITGAKRNKNYPNESMDEFVSNLISLLKKRIINEIS